MTCASPQSPAPHPPGIYSATVYQAPSTSVPWADCADFPLSVMTIKRESVRPRPEAAKALSTQGGWGEARPAFATCTGYVLARFFILEALWCLLHRPACRLHLLDQALVSCLLGPTAGPHLLPGTAPSLGGRGGGRALLPAPLGQLSPWRGRTWGSSLPSQRS